MKRVFFALVLVGLITGITGASDVYAISEQDIIDRLEGLRMSVERQQEAAAEEAKERKADEDRDVFYLAGISKTKYLVGGLAFVFDNDKTTAAQITRSYITLPFSSAKFGPLAIQGELAYVWGETNYNAADQAGLDIDEITYNLEATFDLGVASVQAGYAFFSGDNNGTADDKDSSYNANFGDNWDKLFILTSDENPVLCENLGGAGNLSTVSGNTAAGAKLYYAGASFTPMKNLKLSVVAGIADADKVLSGRDDDIGTEYDLTLNWRIYDNLTYSAIAAYLDAGNFWKDGDATVQLEDTYALFHELKLTF